MGTSDIPLVPFASAGFFSPSCCFFLVVIYGFDIFFFDFSLQSNTLELDPSYSYFYEAAFHPRLFTLNCSLKSIS